MLIGPEPADLFEYPAHIDRDSLDALPSRPGIYIFRDEAGTPLYIGKSVNIRSRVLSHLRTPQEARLLKQSRTVEFRRTAGEIGALLLESRLIKELQPLHNKKLRRTRDMCTLRLGSDGAPEIAYARELDFTTTEGLYGLFATRRAALERLRALIEAHQLCAVVTGLEAGSRGRACFARQLARCRGACVGAESLETHALRLRQALEDLRIVVWPYPGAVGIVEECDGWRQTHVVDHWFYLGSFDQGDGQAALKRPARRVFDVDSYQILVKPLVQMALEIVPVTIGGKK
ncbi:MAG TPA: endonuclease [Burkholderiaceae bacterium]|nr:endonuclease [Burkholderiaceae bacterium]